MPNYGKEFTSLKKRMKAESRRHQKKGVRFGSCKCDELAAEAVQRQGMAYNEGKFGKANAFGKLLDPSTWFSKKDKWSRGTDDYEPKESDELFYEGMRAERREMNPRDGRRFTRAEMRGNGLMRQDGVRGLPASDMTLEESDYALGGDWGGSFGSDPRLWEMQGPFYNAGYN